MECKNIQISSSCELYTVLLGIFSSIQPRTDPSKLLRCTADADAKGFEESAKQGIQIVDTDAGYALTDAQNLVDTYVNDMKATQTAKVGEFRKAVSDAMQRVLTKFQSGKEKFSSNYLTLQRKNTNDVQTADSKLRGWHRLPFLIQRNDSLSLLMIC